MGAYLVVGTSLLTSYVLYYVLSTILEARRHARNAARLGCKKPPERTHKWPLAIDHVQRIMKADKESRVPSLFLDVYHELGCPSTWRQTLLGTENLVTVDPKNVQALLSTQFSDFALGRLRRANFFPMLGNGIFTEDGRAWEHSRALLRPQFSRDQISDLELEETHVQNLLRHLTTDVTGWTAEVDLQRLFFNLTLDSATEFLLGESVNIQLASLPEPPSSLETRDQSDKKIDWSTFARDWDYSTHGLSKRARLGEMYWLHSPSSWRESCRRVHQFADYYVDLALTASATPSKQSNALQDHKADRYVFLHELASRTRDPVELRSQLLNILLAGRDTTAGLLGWTFLMLARKPDVYTRLRDTVLDHFGSYDSPHDVTFSTLKSCSFLQHVIHETLRLYPVVPLNSRRATRDTTLPRGGGPDGKSPVYVKKGQEVNYLLHVIHHRRDIWGDDVEEFKPERWQGKKVGWEYLPFNGGPRICLGQQLALTETAYVIVRMVQKFAEIQNADKRPGPPPQLLTLTSSTDECWVRLKLGD